MFGINDSLANHVKSMSQKNWQLQRDQQTDMPNICTLRRKLHNTNLPSYLDNKENFTETPNVPVLSNQIKYFNQYGKLVVDTNIYFIFLDDVDVKKDDLIIYGTLTYAVEVIFSDPPSTGLIRVEGKMV